MKPNMVVFTDCSPAAERALAYGAYRLAVDGVFDQILRRTAVPVLLLAATAPIPED